MKSPMDRANVNALAVSKEPTENVIARFLGTVVFEEPLEGNSPAAFLFLARQDTIFNGIFYNNWMNPPWRSILKIPELNV